MVVPGVHKGPARIARLAVRAPGPRPGAAGAKVAAAADIRLVARRYWSCGRVLAIPRGAAA
jgi:hypothetical protein